MEVTNPRARRRLLMRLEHEFRTTQAMTGRAGPSSRVWWALSTVPRDAFVPEAERGSAWFDLAIPIGHGQSLSQPFLVALMTDLLDISPDDAVLEIGTGSGYQAAILATLARRVSTVEIVRELADQAAARLIALGHPNVDVHHADGADGLPEEGPFDAILVNAAAPEIPRALIEQLRPGGKMVLPVASRGGPQQLLLVQKANDGRISWRSVLPVSFAPMARSGSPPPPASSPHP